MTDQSYIADWFIPMDFGSAEIPEESGIDNYNFE